MSLGTDATSNFKEADGSVVTTSEGRARLKLYLPSTTSSNGISVRKSGKGSNSKFPELVASLEIQETMRRLIIIRMN